MFSNLQVRGLTALFATLQARLASGLRNELREHTVLVSVSVSDKAGNVLQGPIEPAGKTSSRTVGSVSNQSQFATGINLDTPTKRIAAMMEVAAFVFSLSGDDGCVISATFQDTPLFSGTTMDYVAQAFMKDGKLTIKEVDVADRS